MPSSRKPSDPVKQILDEAESELSRRLREACEVEARGVSTESAEEIRQLEDTLLAALMAAERTLTARKHMRTDDDAAAADARAAVSPGAKPAVSKPGAEPGVPSEPTCSPPSTAVREFEDESGRVWRAWPVTPGLGRSRENARRGLGEFQDGWICFEALDNSGRRRLPRREPAWSELPPEELLRLLAEAAEAPGRKVRADAKAPGDPELH